MTSRLAFVFVATVVVLIGAGSTLSIMNKACKTGQHGWCAPASMTRHHVKIGQR